MWRKSFLSSVAGGAIVASAAAHGQMAVGGTDITPFTLDISPFGMPGTSLATDINPFEGDINPFYGDISPFYGDISPFWGDISPFWGDIAPFIFPSAPNTDINPFGGTSSLTGDINPFGGDINPFTGDINPFWGDISPFEDGFYPVTHASGLGGYWNEAGQRWGDLYANWSAASTSADFTAVLDELKRFVKFSDNNWEDTFEAATGTVGFTGNFARPFLEKYGIDLNDAETLRGLDDAQRSALFLDWYDSLMAYSGMDQVDHWMPAVNWTPRITQEQGLGNGSNVGLIDMAISQSDDNIEYLVNAGGYNVDAGAHGAAVASLIAARHDHEGVMGIAPHATVHAYNPFDATGTTNAEDVRAGVNTLVGIGANVINMSLGVSGTTFDQSMADILTDSSFANISTQATFVFAAGNDGVSQSGTVDWQSGGFGIENILIVGSVDPTGTISSFSNRPGTACFSLDTGECEAMMNRFIVAPGELLLASDNEGGTTRVTGTSFAAPLVTGAIALMHDRWPWLKEHAAATTTIVLETARDLGAPGVDEVYGHGMLDVEATQSPLNFDDLEIYFEKTNNHGEIISSRSMASATLKNSILTPGVLGLWNSERASVFAIEEVGDTYRDFNIPLSDLILNTEAFGIDFRREKFQTFITDRMIGWANGKHKFDQLFDEDDMHVISFASVDENVALVTGTGEAAQHLSLMSTGTSANDFDPQSGGTNPFLGFAAGGSYGRMTIKADKDLFVSFGMSGTPAEQRTMDHISGRPLDEDPMFGSRDALAATAEVVYEATDRLQLGSSLTALNELNGTLGAQGAGALSLEGGARTTAMTLTGRYAATETFDVTASMTAGITRQASDEGALRITDDGLRSTAFQLTLAKSALFADDDRLSLSFIQPLHVEDGDLAFTSAQVVDRQSGELGSVTQLWEAEDAKRHLALEAQYAISLNLDAIRFSTFLRHDANVQENGVTYDDTSAGARISLKF